MVFGLEKKWTRTFGIEGLKELEWYKTDKAFDGKSFSALNWSISSSLSSIHTSTSPQSSSSGGGGFSGGGGGGGGGGSW